MAKNRTRSTAGAPPQPRARERETSDSGHPLEGVDLAVVDGPDFKEDSVREVIILPILAGLGYGPSGPNRIVRSRTLEHPVLRTGSKSRRLSYTPDYLLEKSGVPFCVLDAKAPGEPIITGRNVEQVYGYAIHPEIRSPYYALCNGREFVLFKVDEGQAVLAFSLQEFERYWPLLQSYLTARDVPGGPTTLPSVPRTDSFDYRAITPPLEITRFQKQAAKRHHGVHGYFTRQVWSVVSTYIKTFTQPGDVVLDPYGGSGVTLIEALMNGRQAVHVDINPLSEFVVRTLIRPVPLAQLVETFNDVERRFRQLEPKSDDEIEAALQKYPYPCGIRLPRTSDVEFIEQLFSRRQLAHLALLKALIVKVDNAAIRDALLLMFSGLINKVNLTYHASAGRTEGRGDSSVFRYYRYRIAPRPAELDTMVYFRSRLKNFLAAKKELAIVPPSRLEAAIVMKGTATDLSAIPSESVDYIYTDPPYGSKIQYLDLSIMFNAWLDLPVTGDDYDEEVIEGGEHEKTYEQYSAGLSQSIGEMARVLKFDRWMSFVFAHSVPAYWHMIVDAAERAGFEYVGAIKQSNGQTSFKKRQHPFTVLSGQLIINFRKVKNPKTIGRMALGAPVMDVVMNTIEAVIAQHDGATLEQINDQLVISGLENGFLDVLAKEYADLTPLLIESFDYDEKTRQYQIRPNRKFKTAIPLHLRVRYFVVSYLRRMERLGKYPTFDEVVLNVMPLLKNGVTPETQTIRNVLESVAKHVGLDRWKLLADIGTQQDLLDTANVDDSDEDE